MFRSLGVLSLAIYYITLSILSTDALASTVQPEFNGLVNISLSSPKSTLMVLLAPFGIVIPDLGYLIITKMMRRSVADEVVWRYKKRRVKISKN